MRKHSQDLHDTEQRLSRVLQAGRRQPWSILNFTAHVTTVSMDDSSCPFTVTSKYVGESEKRIVAFFSMAAKCRKQGLVTVAFIDEVDCIMTSRSSSGSSAMTGQLFFIL